jgi:hypothetical protein
MKSLHKGFVSRIGTKTTEAVAMETGPNGVSSFRKWSEVQGERCIEQSHPSQQTSGAEKEKFQKTPSRHPKVRLQTSYAGPQNVVNDELFTQTRAPQHAPSASGYC